MTDKTHRSAVTGQYVTAEHAAENPDTTVSESPCAECERLGGVVHALRVALDGANAKITELTGDLASIRAYCEAFVEESEDPDPEPWNPAAYVLSILEGGCEPVEPEPACLIHDTTGEDVRGWEMAECTCPRRNGHEGGCES